MSGLDLDVKGEESFVIDDICVVVAVIVKTDLNRVQNRAERASEHASIRFVNSDEFEHLVRLMFHVFDHDKDLLTWMKVYIYQHKFHY